MRRTIRQRAGALSLLLVLGAGAGELSAQEVVPPELSLEEALDLARAHNPAFLQSLNDEHVADWNVRQAWGALLPSASANSSVSWQGPGEQQFGTLTLDDLGFGNQPSYYQSSYGINVNYSIDWATILGPRQAKADRSATVAQIGVARAALTSQVTTAYVETLRQQDAVRTTEQQLESSQLNLRLAQGQLAVGTVTPIDVGTAEVQVGRAEVAVLQARNALATARMRLLQQLGLPIDQEFELETQFFLTEPTWNDEELTQMALANNPQLRSLRSSRESADVGVSAARSPYFPSLSISTGWSGFTSEASDPGFQVAQAQAQVASAISQCVSTNDLYSRLADPLPPLDCSRFAFTDEQRRAIIDENDQFPFGFRGSPPRLTVGVSIPIFQGLSRQRNLEAAQVQRDDLAQQVREQELALDADIAIGLANVRTAYQSALLEQRNRDLAQRQLDLARERYQLGAATFVELVDAQTVLTQAEGSRINAVFAYHDAMTNLEALVGASLRD